MLNVAIKDPAGLGLLAVGALLSFQQLPVVLDLVVRVLQKGWEVEGPLGSLLWQVTLQRTSGCFYPHPCTPFSQGRESLCKSVGVSHELEDLCLTRKSNQDSTPALSSVLGEVGWGEPRGCVSACCSAETTLEAGSSPPPTLSLTSCSVLVMCYSFKMWLGETRGAWFPVHWAVSG